MFALRIVLKILDMMQVYSSRAPSSSRTPLPLMQVPFEARLVTGLREHLLVYSWQASLRMLLKLGEMLIRRFRTVLKAKAFKIQAICLCLDSEVLIKIVEMNSPVLYRE